MLVNINLGEEISRRRREQKLTQEDLAELSDLSVNFISRVERTKDQNISIQKLDSIAKALNTTTPDIINNAYRAKKIKPEKIHDNNTPVFMKKVINELRKLPEPKAERVCKSLITLLKEMNNFLWIACGFHLFYVTLRHILVLNDKKLTTISVRA